MKRTPTITHSTRRPAYHTTQRCVVTASYRSEPTGTAYPARLRPYLMIEHGEHDG